MQEKSDNICNLFQRLDKLRWQMRLTRDEMGEKLGVTGHYVYLVESQKKPGTLKLLRKIEALEKKFGLEFQKEDRVEPSLGSGKILKNSGERIPPGGVQNEGCETKGRVKYPEKDEVGAHILKETYPADELDEIVTLYVQKLHERVDKMKPAERRTFLKFLAEQLGVDPKTAT